MILSSASFHGTYIRTKRLFYIEYFRVPHILRMSRELLVDKNVYLFGVKIDGFPLFCYYYCAIPTYIISYYNFPTSGLYCKHAVLFEFLLKYNNLQKLNKLLIILSRIKKNNDDDTSLCCVN